MTDTLRKILNSLFQPMSFNRLINKKNKLRSNIILSLSIMALITVMASCDTDNDNTETAKDIIKTKSSENTSCTEIITGETSKPVKKTTPVTSMSEKQVSESDSTPFMTKMPEQQIAQSDSTPFMTKMPEFSTKADEPISHEVQTQIPENKDA